MPLMKSGNARAKDSFTDPDYKEAENPQAHKYTHDPETKKCIHCGYGLAAHRDNGTGMVRGNKFTAYDGLKPIPVDDQVLGHGAAGDRELRPIPVNDTEWNDPKPRGSYKLTTSAALKTPSEVKEAYAPRGEEGFKKTFGKDDLKPIPVGDSDESDYQEAERKLAAARDSEPSIGKNIAGYYFKLKGEVYGGYPTRAEALREYKVETSKKAKDAGEKRAKHNKKRAKDISPYAAQVRSERELEDRAKNVKGNIAALRGMTGNPEKYGYTASTLAAEIKTQEGLLSKIKAQDKLKAKDADPRRQSYATPSGTTKVDEKLPPSDSLHSYEALAKLAKRLKLSPSDVGSQLMPDGKYHAYAKAQANDCCYFVMS